MAGETIHEQLPIADNNNLILADSLRTGMWGIAALGSKAIEGVLPNNFDPGLHMGNLGMTMATMMLTMGALRSYGPNRLTSEVQTYRSFIKKALVIGTVASVAANVIAEMSPAVEHLYGRATVPDVQDFAYGMLGGYIGVRMMTNRFRPIRRSEHSQSTSKHASSSNNTPATRITEAIVPKQNNLKRMQKTSRRKNRR